MELGLGSMGDTARLVAKLATLAGTDKWGYALQEFSARPSYRECEQLSSLEAVLATTLLNDQLTEYQLFNPAKLFDLINKKVLAVNNLPKITGLEQLKTALYTKIIHLLILLTPDHRQLSVVKFLRREPVPLNPITHEMLRLVEGDQLVPLEMVDALLDSHDGLEIMGGLVSRLISVHPRQTWTHNVLQGNIIRLSKYYSEISLAKIGELFACSEITLESMVCLLIIGDKFPVPTKIDQAHGKLVFEIDETATVNLQLAQVVGVINDISYDIK